MSAEVRGREAVRRALISAATRLFAARGPRSVSVRDVAAKAGVNHGLVHRHFGSKQGLTEAVMRKLVADLEADLGPDDGSDELGPMLATLLQATRRHRAYWQILARALLDGTDPRRLQASFPVVQRLRARLDAVSDPTGALEPRAMTAVVVATGLGLVAFGPFIRVAVGLSQTQFDALVQQLPYLLQASVRVVKTGPAPR